MKNVCSFTLILFCSVSLCGNTVNAQGAWTKHRHGTTHKSHKYLSAAQINTTPKDTKTTQKLQQIITTINAIKSDLTQKQRQQLTVQQELKTTEVNLHKVAARHQATQKKLTKQQEMLTKLTTLQTKKQQHLQTTQTRLATQVKVAYLLSKQEPCKMLLNQEDPTTIDRMLVYHRYLLQSRLGLITDITGTIGKLKRNKNSVEQHSEVLYQLQTEQQNERQELTTIKSERKQTLATIQERINLQNEKLKTLLANKANLERIIATISANKKLSQAPKSRMQMCGKFVWPTAGKITTHYGSSIVNSQWKWNAILISAPEQQAVKAIASGTVVYAGKLSGYGLLLIIDHGGGYMSLYGQNHSIYKKLADEVNAGENIATVGHSDEDPEPKLYFAIRHNGKPVNPETWCKKL